ncbi:peptidase T-like protein [Thermanaerovibrio velox DSM 12556]|uniref:Peptidase T-like protein n=1 Tax=Thermanaerovibrio velox DSM 12556 TaxID=926567 RepID=H0UMS2_9BACT|nr:M20/M25/M40 family metallo-hydrolase [Thermanaerovibrio velox]EHM09217.1 peptidase T-like protein [Thermanaerovibrio velox DSM 12556]
MINRDRLLEEFLELVKVPSPSGKEKALADLLTEKLRDLGLKVTVDDAGDKIGGQTGNVIARLDGTIDAEPVLFSCHMDTVSPCEKIVPIVKNNAIYSDGTSVLGADDKAGIAAVLEALRCLKESQEDHGPVEVVFSVWEEGGLRGAQNLDTSLITARHAYVLDSGGDVGEIVIKGPAQDRIDVVIKGRSAHAGVAPEEGVSAIMIAARAIEGMRLLRIDHETTANVGYISGGGATNIVTPEVVIKAEARSLDEAKLDRQSAHMAERFKRAAEEMGGTAEVTVARAYPPFNVDEESLTVRMVKEAAKRMGLAPKTCSTGGGSDTNILNSKGISAVNLGIGERKPHTLEEHIYIKDLENTSALVLEIVRSFAAGR